MSIDAWAVKLKPESKNNSFIDWDDCIEDDKWEDIIPKDNYIQMNGYRKIHHSFINMLLKTRDYTYKYEDEDVNIINTFTGDPCCDYITLRVVRDRLKDFIRAIELNNMFDYKWIDVEYCLDTIDYTQIKDLFEYMDLALKNDFLIWFSF